MPKAALISCPIMQLATPPQQLVSMTCIGLRHVKLKSKFRWYPAK